jgi:hypothetical protein
MSESFVEGSSQQPIRVMNWINNLKRMKKRVTGGLILRRTLDIVSGKVPLRSHWLLLHMMPLMELINLWERNNQVEKNKGSGCMREKVDTNSLCVFLVVFFTTEIQYDNTGDVVTLTEARVWLLVMVKTGIG